MAQAIIELSEITPSAKNYELHYQKIESKHYFSLRAKGKNGEPYFTLKLLSTISINSVVFETPELLIEAFNINFNSPDSGAFNYSNGEPVTHNTTDWYVADEFTVNTNNGYPFNIIDFEIRANRHNAESGHMLMCITVSNGTTETDLANYQTNSTTVLNDNCLFKRLGSYQRNESHHVFTIIQPSNNSFLADTAVSSLTESVNLPLTDNLIFRVKIRRGSGNVIIRKYVTKFKLS